MRKLSLTMKELEDQVLKHSNTERILVPMDVFMTLFTHFRFSKVVADRPEFTDKLHKITKDKYEEFV